MPSITLINEKISISHLKDIVLKQDEELTLPKKPETFLSLKFHNEKSMGKDVDARWVGPTPFSDSDIVNVNLIKCRRLTKNDPEVKKTLELTFEFCDENLSFQPGDSFGFHCYNSSDEVENILKCTQMLEYIDVPCDVRLNEESNKKKKIPSHIPTSSNLRHLFTSCLDIRAIPKKAVLLALSTYCDNQLEQKILEFLCSRKGSLYYSEFIVQHMVSVLDLLQLFPSCHPPIECLIEHLPSLKPRFYSVVSSPLESEKSFQIIYNVIEIEKTCHCCKRRKGVCTSWLEVLSEELLSKNDSQELGKDAVNSITETVSHLNLTNASTAVPEISVYKRKNSHFKLPEDARIPVIMIGRGTSVAPFIGFLNHREREKKNSGNEVEFGEMWLLYGCRYEEKDFLYRDELNHMLQSNILCNLLTCFSRDEKSNAEQSPQYVQDLIRIHAEALWRVISAGAVIYVCVDARNNMVEAIQNVFKEIIRDTSNMSDSDAEDFMKSLVYDGRYLTDTWI